MATPDRGDSPTVPDGYKLNLIPVDSGCTVSNINDGSIVHAEHRMSASRPIQVASKDVDPIYPDYEGYGSINTLTQFGSIKNIRMGRCVCAPSVRNLLSVSSMAKKGHKIIMNENNPRMICRDGTIVPMYYFQDLFLSSICDTNRVLTRQWGLLPHCWYSCG